MKYLVLYVWLHTFSVPCPHSIVPLPDEFGRTSGLQSYTLEACLDTEAVDRSRCFDTEKEASDFVERGMKEEDLINFVIIPGGC